jgi:site-specific recombinase XerD
MNLLEFFREYLITRDTAPSKATVKNYLSDIRKFIMWYEMTYHTRFQPQAITSGIIAKYREDKLARIRRGHAAIGGMSASSVERYTSSLRKFFTCLNENGLISTSPFDVPSEAKNASTEDKWHLKAFKNTLYIANTSDLTIKNYLIDIRQFLSWAEAVTKDKGNNYVIDRSDLLTKITPNLTEEYKYRLLHTLKLSPVSINRKLSALRKYLSWASDQGLLTSIPSIGSNIADKNVSQTNSAERYQNITEVTNDTEIFTANKNETPREKSYSRFPPLRLLQKLHSAGSVLLELALIIPLTFLAEKLEFAKWALTGQKLFITSSSRLPKEAISTGSISIDPLDKIVGAMPNYKKSFYAPLSISTAAMPLHKRIVHRLRYARPKWYKKYHSYTFVHYIHLALLIIFMSGVGGYIYRSYFIAPKEQLDVLAANVSPPRILSFQGRLADNNDTPITAKTNLRFGIYNSQTASGSAMLWQEVDSVTPDENGIFSVTLGSGTPIPQSLFGQNAALFIGISVGTDAELVPRQQIATVAYATNSELLQGMPAITQPNAGTANVVLALDSSGNLTIGGTASPTFQATGGTFTLSGNTLNLTTTGNGNVIVAPGGAGTISLQSPIQNLGNNNTIPGISGAVQFNDNIGINNTGSQTSLSIYQTSSANAIMASQSGTTIFSVAGNGIGFLNQALGIGETNPSTRLYVNSGGDATTATFNSGVTPNTIFSFLSSGNQFASVSRNSNNDLQVATNNNANIIFSPGGNIGIGTTTPGSFPVQIAGNLGPNASNTYNLGSSSMQWSNVYANTLNGQNLNLSGLTNSGGVLYTNASGSVAQTSTGTIGDCLISQGTAAPTWSPCAAASGGVWTVGNGAIMPIYQSADLLIGGSSTASAKFAVLNVASGTPVAYINGNMGIGTTTPGANADIVGTLRASGLITANGGITFGSGQTLSIGSDIIGDFVGTGLQLNGTTLETTLGTTIDLTSEVAGILPIANGGTNSTAVPSAGAIAYGTGSAYAFSSIGSAGQCLISGGAAAPSWSNCDGANYWLLSNGALSPSNNTNDILLGSSATASALIKLGGTAGAISYFNAGNVGIGTTNPGYKLEVNGDVLLGSGTGDINLDAGADNVVINLSSTGDFLIEDNATPFAVFTDSGNVGIGTTAPSELLHIRKDQAAATKLAIQNTNASGQEVFVMAGDSTQWNFGQTNSDDTFKISSDSNGSLDVNTRLAINSSGNVGIGTTNPGRTLDVAGNWGGNVIDGSATDPGTTTVTVSGKGLVYRLVATKTSGNASNTTTFNITGLPDTDGTIAYILIGAIKNTAIGASAQQCVNLQVNSSANILATALCSTVGTGADADYKQFILVRINGSWTAFNTPNTSTAFATFPDTADLAEWVPFVGVRPQPGDLVSVAKTEGSAAVAKTETEQDPSVIGIVSSNPHTVMGIEAENSIRLALTGHVPVKVSTKNGSIKKGDYLTSSDIPGVAVKAVKPGTVIGKSLENYSNPDPGSIGTVTVFINASWHDPDVYITNAGDLSIDMSSNQPKVKHNGRTIDRVAAFEEAVVGKIKGGIVEAQNLAVAGMLSAGQVTAESITVAGMSLREYILTIVEQTQRETEIISPVDGRLAVNIISPLGSDSDIALAFSKDEISVTNKAGEKIAMIDNKGNASLSGTITAKNASIAGTLKTERIEADELALSEEGLTKLKDKLGTSSATIITNITNVYQQATPSATPTITLTPTPSSTDSGTTAPATPTTQTDYADISSMSGILAYVPSLSADFATFTQGLMAFGPSSLSDTSVTGNLTVNGNMILAENSINVLGADLQIQPLRQGNISFMSGLVKIDIDGNMSVEGNATFSKKVAIRGLLETNFVSPIPGEDLVINLPSVAGSDRASSFVIADASGSAKFKVNNVGDVIASGSGQFKNLTADAFKIIRGAQADTSTTETVATASAGTAIIGKNQTERTIYSPFVKEDSLIYITPNSNTEGLTPYIARQSAEDKEHNSKGSFTIQLPDRAPADIKVNWWIVN